MKVRKRRCHYYHVQFESDVRLDIHQDSVGQVGGPMYVIVDPKMHTHYLNNLCLQKDSVKVLF